MSQVAGPVDGKSTGISTSRWIKVSESTSKVDPSVNPKEFKVLLSSSVKGQIQNIQASRTVKKKDVWNLWFFKPYPRGHDGTYNQISVLWNVRIYILFKTVQLISTRKLLDSSPSHSQASAVAKSISPSFRSLTNMKRKHLHKPHKPHKVAPFLMHASGLQWSTVYFLSEPCQASVFTDRVNG